MVKEIQTFNPNIEVVSNLVKYEVEFLIVGGHAVAFYNCRSFEEILGKDLDILINTTYENVVKTLDALKSIPLFANAEFPSTEEFQKNKIQFPLKRYYNVEILTPFRDVEFEKLISKSEPAIMRTNQAPLKVRVISKADLIDMKIDAVQNQIEDKEKHQLDLERLYAV